MEEPALEYAQGTLEDQVAHLEALVHHLYGHLGEADRETMRAIKPPLKTPAPSSPADSASQGK